MQRQAADTRKYAFGYNADDELEEAVLKSLPSQTVLRRDSYGYDGAGNRVAVARDGQFTGYTANARNQLTAAGGSGPMKFRGTVSEPSAVTLAETPV